VVIVPIHKGEEDLNDLREYVKPVMDELKALGIRVRFDDDDTKRPGWKFAEHELRGVPVRLVIGPKDKEAGVFELARRDVEGKTSIPRGGIAPAIEQLLASIQRDLYNAAKDRLDANTFRVDTWEEFAQRVETGGFLLCHWDGTPETEAEIKQLTQATIRCIPLEAPTEDLQPGKCIRTGKPSARRVIFAKAY
jgi:prolyl-tRNA synthetase